jgi:hypothetical protein
MTDKQRALRVNDELWSQVTQAAESAGVSVNKFLVSAIDSVLHPAIAGKDAQDRSRRTAQFSGLVKLLGPTAGYPFHPHEQNVKSVIGGEDWVHRYKLPFTVSDMVAACYAAGDGDPWEGFVRSRMREQMNDALDDVGSRPAVLRSRLREIAGVA